MTDHVIKTKQNKKFFMDALCVKIIANSIPLEDQATDAAFSESTENGEEKDERETLHVVPFGGSQLLCCLESGLRFCHNATSNQK